jgi:hypothetical protein
MDQGEGQVFKHHGSAARTAAVLKKTFPLSSRALMKSRCLLSRSPIGS